MASVCFVLLLTQLKLIAGQAWSNVKRAQHGITVYALECMLTILTMVRFQLLFYTISGKKF